ncbi:MAG: DNA polymerase III subunit delta [Chitinophagales bacterium]|nr:DNA polymerase III subunit delta [Chitinophagales bacterium]MDW8420180.1 DNA polymerase III subunit delta [Chitinophagales bacterium]
MPAATVDSVLADIGKRRFAPLYFLCGEETYFIDRIAHEIEQNALSDAERAFNQTILYGKDTTAQQIVETAGRLPLMAERQLVIVREAQALSLKENDEALLLRYIRNPAVSTVLVFAWKHGKPDGRKSFAKEIQKHAVYVESKPLYENQVIPWIREWLAAKKLKIDDYAATLLVESAGTDLTKIANELEKICIQPPAGGLVKAEHIAKYVGISKEFNVFEYSKAIRLRHVAHAQQIANYFKANPRNGPFVLILSTLYADFTRLYQIHLMKNASDKELAAAAGINPYFLKDYKAAAVHYRPADIERAFHLLREYDLRYKGVESSNNISEGELLRELTYRLLH